jgi:hypothetical protein
MHVINNKVRCFLCNQTEGYLSKGELALAVILQQTVKQTTCSSIQLLGENSTADI